MLTATKGTAVLNTIVTGYQAWAGEISTRELGSLVCHETGQVCARWVGGWLNAGLVNWVCVGRGGGRSPRASWGRWGLARN